MEIIISLIMFGLLVVLLPYIVAGAGVIFLFVVGAIAGIFTGIGSIFKSIFK